MTRLGPDLERAGEGARSRRAPGSRRATSGRRRRPGRRSRERPDGRWRSRRRRPRRRRGSVSSGADHADRVDRGERERRRRLAGDRDHRRRRAVAQPEARAAQPGRAAVPDRLAGRPDGPRQVRADRLRAGQPAGDVVADVGDDRRPRRRREQRVERGHAVRLGRGDGQPPADVVERRLADPADPRLDGVEGRQQLGAPGARRVPAARGVPVDRASRAAPPTQPDSGGPSTASTAARSAGDASGPMTCRSIASSVGARRGAVRRWEPRQPWSAGGPAP